MMLVRGSKELDLPVSDDKVLPGETDDWTTYSTVESTASASDNDEFNERYDRVEIRSIVGQARYRRKRVPAFVPVRWMGR
jgi:hypothetical protein